jgi:hypothetical protein
MIDDVGHVINRATEPLITGKHPRANHQDSLAMIAAMVRGSGPGCRRRWPLVIALAADDPGLLNPLGNLMWQLTRSVQASDEKARDFDFLANWMRAAEKDPA